MLAGTFRWLKFVDITSLVSSSAIRVIDLSYFGHYCVVFTLDLETLCSVELVEEQSESVKQCGYLLSGVRVGNVDRCLYGVEEDCTVWTFKNGDSDGRLDMFQADEKVKKMSYVGCLCRDVYISLMDMVQKLSLHYRRKPCFICIKTLFDYIRTKYN